MGATEARHALIFRTNGLAPSGVMGVWLLAGMLGAGPAGGAEQGAAPEPLQAQSPAAVPAARKAHGSYLFFTPGGRTTPRPSAQPGGMTLVQAPARPAYLYFAPGKNAPPIVPIGPVARPIPPDAPPPAEARPPADKDEAVAVIPSPRPVRHQTLIFFAPKRVVGPKDQTPPRDGQPPLAALPTARKPPAGGPVDKIPVRLPGSPVRKPQPYLIFQPKEARVRPGAPPIEKGSSPSATLDRTSPERIAAIDTPASLRPESTRRAGRPPAPPTYRIILESRIEPSTIPPLRFPTLQREASGEPPPVTTAALAGESGPAPSLSMTPPPRRPSALPTGGVARPRRGAKVPAGPPPMPDPVPMDPEPIRLTSATTESFEDQASPGAPPR